MTSTTDALPGAAPLPRPERAVLVASPSGVGPGHWAGAPSAVLEDGTFWLAYRLRRPIGEGRGYALVIARSDDGERFEPVAELHQADFGTDSFERPALVRRPDGGWRLYVSCATPGTLHWRVDALDADHPSMFQHGTRVPVLPGDAGSAFKDPVVRYENGRWHLWVCVHTITDPHQADRMDSRYATSRDGLTWSSPTVVLEGRPGRWDERGARIADVLLGDDAWVAYYDGRRSYAENWEERTGIAVSETGSSPFAALGADPVASSPYGLGGLRYLSAVPLPNGGHRLFYELTRGDGSHDVRTEYVPPSR